MCSRCFKTVSLEVEDYIFHVVDSIIYKIKAKPFGWRRNSPAKLEKNLQNMNSGFWIKLFRQISLKELVCVDNPIDFRVFHIFIQLCFFHIFIPYFYLIMFFPYIYPIIYFMFLSNHVFPIFIQSCFP